MMVHEDQHALTPCQWTDKVIIYARGGSISDRSGELEQHISSCDTCRKALSAYARLVEPEVTDKEEKLIDSIEQSVIQAAVALYPKRPQPAPKRRSIRTDWDRRWLPRAATIIFVSALVLTIFIFIVNPKKSMFERGQAAYVLGISQKRPLQYRITESPYAPFARMRGDAEQRQIMAAHFLLQTSLSQNPSPQTRHALGRVLLAKGDIQAALSILNEAVAASPNDPMIRCDKAIALAENKDFEGAKREIETVLNSDPADPAALFNYAIINYQLGRKDLVSEYSRRLKSVEPSSQWTAELSNLANSP
jgi:tetratricopeptide (TPR) repeat protein